MSNLPEGWGTVVGDTEGVFSPQCRDELLNPDMPTQELLLHMGELTKSEILVARAAIRWANSQIPQWMPISEAPKDGSRNLGLTLRNNIEIIRWCTYCKHFEPIKCYPNSQPNPYTHFMHLPKPPAE